MRRIALKLCVVASIALASAIVACDDVGDDLPGGGDDASGDASRDATTDATAHDANTAPDATESDSAVDGDQADEGNPDTSAADVNPPDTSVPDTSIPDASVPDINVPDSNTPDTSTPDTSVHDANTPDTNAPDTSAPDTGVDAGADTGLADSGPPDTGPKDTGAPDSGPSPCAAFNGGAGCSPTEQRFVDKSVACYQCMANAGCLDDTLFADNGHECGDLTGNAAHGAKTGTARSSLCLATIDCIMTPAIECASDDVNICYCGTLGSGNGCATAASGANGQCLQQEVDGLEHASGDAPSAVLPDYTDLTRGAGMANQLFVCAKVNSCDALCAK